MSVRKHEEIPTAGFILSKTLICLHSGYNKGCIQRGFPSWDLSGTLSFLPKAKKRPEAFP
jgi:hypothetical protein